MASFTKISERLPLTPAAYAQSRRLSQLIRSLQLVIDHADFEGDRELRELLKTLKDERRTRTYAI